FLLPILFSFLYIPLSIIINHDFSDCIFPLSSCTVLPRPGTTQLRLQGAVHQLHQFQGAPEFLCPVLIRPHDLTLPGGVFVMLHMDDESSQVPSLVLFHTLPFPPLSRFPSLCLFYMVTEPVLPRTPASFSLL